MVKSCSVKNAVVNLDLFIFFTAELFFIAEIKA